MAPNLKRTQFLLQTFDLDLLQPVKAAFPPLTSEVVAPSTTIKKVIVATTPQQDISNYWEWSAENDEEINCTLDEERFSVDHIVDNIVRQPVAAPTSRLSQANDDYWAWESREQQRNVDYWRWPTAKDELRDIVREQISNTEIESYWAW